MMEDNYFLCYEIIYQQEKIWFIYLLCYEIEMILWIKKCERKKEKYDKKRMKDDKKARYEYKYVPGSSTPHKHE